MAFALTCALQRGVSYVCLLHILVQSCFPESKHSILWKTGFHLDQGVQQFLKVLNQDILPKINTSAQSSTQSLNARKTIKSISKVGMKIRLLRPGQLTCNEEGHIA